MPVRTRSIQRPEITGKTPTIPTTDRFELIYPYDRVQGAVNEAKRGYNAKPNLTGSRGAAALGRTSEGYVSSGRLEASVAHCVWSEQVLAAFP